VTGRLFSTGIKKTNILAATEFFQVNNYKKNGRTPSLYIGFRCSFTRVNYMCGIS